MPNKAAFSDKGLPYGAAVDVDALSDRAAVSFVTVPVVLSTAAGGQATAYFTQNTTTNHPLGALGVPSRLVSAIVSSDRVPVGGTLSWQIVAATTDGTTFTVLTNTADPETITANVGQALTAATTNNNRAATDVFFLRATADNTAVGTDARNVKVTLVFKAIEATPPTR